MNNLLKCYLCDEELGIENSSDEHIIPNSIGGRLKSTSLICRKCNGTTGDLFDSEFAKIGNFFASKYNIRRDRGRVPAFKASELTTGKKLWIEPGLKTSYVDPVSGYDEKMIYVEHRDKKRIMEELRRLSKQVGDGEVDPDRIIVEYPIDEHPDNQKQFVLDASVEPELLLRSVCKTIINLYLYKTGDCYNSRPLIEFLRTEIENRFCWFLDLGISKTKHNGAPYHIVIIKGEKKSKMLYAYFEMFGEAGFLALINGKYQGEDQQLNHTFDPINAIEVESDYAFTLKPNDIIQHLIDKPESEMIKCIHNHWDHSN